ncbi:hypothetical protein BGZ72_003707 [Mortierella alpina]|nr:hypothetical protein BGZ72_003707 [Mortierella alpina]
MASAEEILSIIAAILFMVALSQFSFRYLKSRWGIYFFIMTFCLLRVVAYSIRAYMNSGAITPLDKSFMNLYIAELILLSIGVVFIMKLLARLYGAILPKLRAQTSTGPDRFEQCLVERTKYFLLPLIVLVVAGAIYSTPNHSISDQHLGLVLRKVGICLLMILGVWFLHAAFNYRTRYPGNRYAFNIALVATILFDITLVYKLVATFYADAQNQTAVYFIFQALVELMGLGVLSVDLQAYFLGGPPFADEEEHIEFAPRTIHRSC